MKLIFFRIKDIAYWQGRKVKQDNVREDAI